MEYSRKLDATQVSVCGNERVDIGLINDCGFNKL